MIFKIIVHEEPGGGFWAEVPALAGCASQGDTMEELVENVREAIKGCLAAGSKIEEHANAEILAVPV